MKNTKNYLFMLLLFLLVFSTKISGQITYSSATQYQTDITASQPYGVGTKNQKLLRITITTTGSGTALSVTGLNLTVTGSSDIERLAVYKSAAYNIYPDLTLTPFAEVSNPGTSVQLNGVQSITAATTTSLWVVADIKETATIGNTLDVVCESVATGTTTQAKPTINTDRNAVIVANLSGTKTVKASGGDYTTLYSAISDINNRGIANGGLELVLSDDATYAIGDNEFVYNYHFLRQATSQAKKFTLRRSNTGTNKPILTRNATTNITDCFVGFVGSDYVTVDGLELKGAANTSSLLLEYGIYFVGMTADGCNNNEVKNCKISLNNSNSTRTYGIKFDSYAQKPSGVNSNNSISYNSISGADACINFNSQRTTILYNDQNNKIFNNSILGNFGFESGGISFQNLTNTEIYNNTLDGNGVTANYSGTLKGIYTVGLNCSGYIKCYNNIVRNLVNTSATTSARVVGIGIVAPEVQLYNNMISNLKVESTTNTGTYSCGMQISSNSTLNPVYYVYNNSVYLSQVTPSGHRMAGLYFEGAQTLNLNLSNNIIKNTSTGTGYNSLIYSPYRSYSVISSESDNNLYFPENSESFVFSEGKFSTLLKYKTVSSLESNSMIGSAPFTSVSDLHIVPDSTSKVEGNGKYLALVTNDFDGDVRSGTSPDIGADEGTFKPFNVAPSMQKIPDVGLVANTAVEHVVQLTNIQDGNNSVEQAISITATSDRTDLIQNPVIDYTNGTTAQLRFTPNGSGKGLVTISLKIKDDGGVEFGGVDSTVYSFKINVIDPALNNQPTINAVSNLVRYNNTITQTVDLSGISCGDIANNQQLTFKATTDNSTIINNLHFEYIQGETMGQLIYDVVGTGTAHVKIQLNDDGGIVNGGVDSTSIEFDINIREYTTYGFTDNFENTSYNWWTQSKQYVLTKDNGVLNVLGTKDTKWASFGVTLPQSINISENPYIYIKVRPLSAEKPFKLNAYIADASGNTTLQKRVLYADSTYTELFFDFSGQTAVNAAAVTQLLLVINGDALTWTGTAIIDEIKAGATIDKSANIAAQRSLLCAPAEKGRKLYITDVDNATSIEVEHGGNIVENAAISTFSKTVSILNFDIKDNASGTEEITLTAKGKSGYADKSVRFKVSIEENIAPTVDQVDTLNIKVGEPTELKFSGITDGNTTSEQHLLLSIASDQPNAIPGASVTHEHESVTAQTTLTALQPATNVKMTLTVDDQESANHVTTMDFIVNAYSDINHTPSCNVVDDINLVKTEGTYTLKLSGITDGDNDTQNLTFDISSSVDSIVTNDFQVPAYVIGQKEIEIPIVPVNTGTTLITIKITDNGGNSSNNGNQQYSFSFNVNVLDDPLLGYVLPSDNVAEDLANHVWVPATAYSLSQATVDGYTDVIKVDMTNKSTWDGLWLNIPEVNVKDNPYMSMEVYPITKDLYWHVYLYDINNNRNENGAHAARQFLTKGKWNQVFLDYRPDGRLLDNSGNMIDVQRIKGLLFNMHDVNFTWPFTTFTGSFYVRNIRIGDKTVVPVTDPVPTIDKVLDQSLILSATPVAKSVTLTGLSNGNFSTDGVTVTAVSSNETIAKPTVGTIQSNGTALLSYMPGTTTGTAQIYLTVTGTSTTVAKDTFSITIVSNDLAQAVSINIDTTSTYQTMRGFGTWKNEYRYIDLYTEDLGSSAMRIGFVGEQFEPINDNDNPDVTDYSKFKKDIIDWNYLRQLRDKGVEDYILTSWSPPAWMKGNLSLNYMMAGVENYCDATDNKLEYHYYDEFAEMVVAFCKVFKEEMGIELTGFGMQNEPAFHEPYASAILDPAHFVKLIKVVYPKLQAEGLHTKLFMPEQAFGQTNNSMAAYIDALQADTTANTMCSVIATHGYANDGIAAGTPNFTQWTTMWNNAQEGNYPKELWMTETTKIYANYDDAMYWANSILGSLEYGNVSHWTSWTFEDQLFDEKSNKPTSMFYATKNFSKYIRPGAKRVKSNINNTTTVITTTFKNEIADGGNLVSVLINNANTPATVKMTGTGLAPQFEVYQTTAADNFVHKGTVSKNDIVLLPAKSIVTLVGPYGNQAPLIDSIPTVEILNSDPVQQTITLTGISDGDLEAVQDLAISATSLNPTFIAHPVVEYTQGASTALLKFNNPQQTGEATIRLRLKDNGGNQANSVDSTIVQFKIVVKQEINNAPLITAVSTQTLLEDSLASSVLISGISDGDETVVQPLTMDVQCDNPLLIPTIGIDYTSPNDTARISYTVAPQLSGTAKVTVTLNDHGGNSFNDGDKTSTYTFNIVVLPVNDAPTINALSDMEFKYDVSDSILVTGISDGDIDAVQGLTFSIAATNKSTYFNTLRVDYVAGDSVAKIKFTPKGIEGYTTITLKVFDYGGTTNGGINVNQTVFTIHFTPTVGFKNLEQANQLRLYPNPASEKINIETDIQKGTLTITDLTGKVHINTNINGSGVIMLNDLPAGIYFVKIAGEGKNEFNKLIIK